MSIVFYLQADEVEEFQTKRREASLREDIQLDYILCTNMSIYPINKLRNLAIQRVNTSHIYVSDMDNWPGGISYMNLLISCHSFSFQHFSPYSNLLLLLFIIIIIVQTAC